jgi:predicted nucleotidyltransferase
MSAAHQQSSETRMFESILAALVSRRIRFVLVGGVAATVHGSARFTNDVDICYDPAADNVDRLVELLTELQAYLRGVEPGLPFILDARTFRTTPFLTLTSSMGAIDLLDHVPGVGSYKDALARSEIAAIGNTEFRALTLQALIASKKATRRKKDLEHLIELEAILALRTRRT